MIQRKFKKIKYICAILIIISLIASILVPVLPSVDPAEINTKISEPIKK